MESKIRLGISTCLLGEPVRFDGGHKFDHFIVHTLGQYVEYVPVCPEVECGLPIPRESMHLEGDPKDPRLVTSKTHIDQRDRMVQYARRRVQELEKEDLCGFIFKSNSPSSGMERVKVYDKNGVTAKVGVGLFARIFMDHFPLLPVEEEGRLNDPKLRENFIERIFALKRWRELRAQRMTLGSLVAFHTRHKLLLLSHSPKHYQEMGRFAAKGKQVPVQALYDRYQTLLLEALKLKSTSKKNANVLMHMMGYFKEELSADEKQELLEVIDQYRLEMTPLIVPITLMNHFVRKYREPYLQDQVYLQPHPIELQLRNHV